MERKTSLHDLVLAALLVCLAGCASACTQGAEHSGTQPHKYLPEIEHMALVLLPSIKESGELRACFMDKYEVTEGQYRAFLEASGYWPDDDVGFLYRTPLAGRNLESRRKADDEFPVVCVNFHDAQAYASFYGKELPNQEEWLAAAQISSDRPYPWGERFNKFFCNSLRSGIGAPVRVGTFESGRSPYDCYDMAGNVAEWTSERVAGQEFGNGVDVFFVMGGHFDKWGYPTNQRKIFDILRSPEKQESQNRIAHIGFRCVRRDAVRLVARFAERIAALRPEERTGALRELSSAGKEVTNVLRLLDFMQRSRIIHRSTGSFMLDRLGDVTNDGGEELLLKRPDGEVTVISGLGELLWTTEKEFGFYDEFVLLRHETGKVESLVFLEKTASRIAVRDPSTGAERWTARGSGEPQDVIQAQVGGEEVLLTTWVGQETFDGEKRDRSLVTCHDRVTGRQIWEKKISGMLTSFVKVDRCLVTGVIRREQGLRAFRLIAVDDGALIDETLLGGERTVDLVQSGDDRNRLFVVDGPALPEEVLPEAEPAGLANTYLRKPFLELAVRVIGLMADAAAKGADENLPALLEIDAGTSLRAEYFSRANLSKESIRQTVIDPKGVRSDQIARELFGEYMGSDYRVKRVLVGTGCSWFLTEPDRQNRIALLSVSRRGAEAVTVLTGVRGFSYKVLLVQDNGKNNRGGPQNILIWSSGGDMICLDAANGALKWWRQIHAYSGHEALVANFDSDPSPEVVVFSPYGEITVVGVAAGRVKARFKKAGSEITDIEIVDARGTGEFEILTSFKGEGVYSLNPRRLQQQNAIDIALSGMEALERPSPNGMHQGSASPGNISPGNAAAQGQSGSAARGAER